MFEIALRMLINNRLRFAATVGGIAGLFFLSAAQIGLLVGWCDTASAIIRNANADLWIVARQTSAFDHGTAIPHNLICRARTVKGVGWAEGLIVAWCQWQNHDGRCLKVEMVGLDDGLVGGPWRMKTGKASDVYRQNAVIVDDFHLQKLGVERIHDEVEINGVRATVVAISQGIRTFTTCPFIFTSIDNARKYDRYYAPSEVTYIMVRCAPGYSPERVRDAIRKEMPRADCLTSAEFGSRTERYWILGTGMGLGIVLTAVLGFVVSALVTSQSLYTMTQDHLGDYATLSAIGFSRARLVSTVFLQGFALGFLGMLLGSVLFFCAVDLSETTVIPVETTPIIFIGIVLALLATCLAASFLSVRPVLRIDPAAILRR